MPFQDRAKQEQVVNQKVEHMRWNQRRRKELRTGRTEAPKQGEIDPVDQWNRFKEGVKNAGIAIPSTVLGMPSDLIGVATLAGYSGLNWIRGGDPTIPDMSEIPATTDWYGKLLGADPNSIPFMVASFLTPTPTSKRKIVGGPRATTVKGQKLGKLNWAKQLAEDGKLHDFDIWQETGWWREADGNWRFYISDSEAKFSTQALREKVNPILEELEVGKEKVIEVALGDIMAHDKLYENYPELQDRILKIHVTKFDDGLPYIWSPTEAAKGTSGAFDPKTKKLSLYNSNADNPFESTILHEVQHAVQDIEGFDGGTNAKYFEDVITESKEMRKSLAITEAIESGELQEGNLLEWAIDVGEELNMEPLAITEEAQAWLSMGDDAFFENAVNVKGWSEMYDRRVAAMLNELGSEVDPDDFINRVGNRAARKYANLRYRRQMGEHESRVVERLRQRTQEEIDAMRAPPTREATDLRQDVRPVVGDKGQVTDAEI